jgi:hypothetical protein
LNREFHILVDEDTHRITVTDSEGVSRDFEGIALFAGDAFGGGSLIIVHGASTDAAFAFVQGYDKPKLAQFYKSCALQFMRALSPEVFKQEADPEETLERWEREDGGSGKVM